MSTVGHSSVTTPFQSKASCLQEASDAYARGKADGIAEERARWVNLVQSEEEYEGPIPAEMVVAVMYDPETVLRASVATTKRSILKRADALPSGQE